MRTNGTVAAYRGDVDRFRACVPKPLEKLSLDDPEEFRSRLEQQGMAASSRKRALAAIRSLLSYGYRNGGLPTNAGASLKLAVPPHRRAECRLSEAQKPGTGYAWHHR